MAIGYGVNILCPTGVSIGGHPACYIIEHHLSRFVEGQVKFPFVSLMGSTLLRYSRSHSRIPVMWN